MEHLPSASGSPRSASVPYVGKEAYDRGSFLEYPIRKNKSHVLPSAANRPDSLPFWQHEKLYPTPKDELEAFFQTWLFFGLISEFLGASYHPDDFVVDSTEGISSVSTSTLKDSVDNWVTSLEEDSNKLTYDHVAKCLHMVFAALRAVGSDFDARIKFSIASTGELFELAANQAFKIENNLVDNKCPASWHLLVDSNFWTLRMQNSGWCPSQIHLTVNSTIQLQALYFLSSIDYTAAVRNHEMCNEDTCKALQNDLDKYMTKHRTLKCPCQALTVDSNALDIELSNGSLPLLRIESGKSPSKFSATVIPSSNVSSPWVAISHVWADGLGNPKENALPQCQLRDLKDLIEQLPSLPRLDGSTPEVLLWIDTLCCPVSPEDAKKRALEQMKRTYQEAPYVLVIEASLRMHNSKDMDSEELLARILLSGWMRRLWTLQEGTLPGENWRLWFQFRDRAINFRSLWDALLRTFWKNLGRRGLAADLISKFMSFTSLEAQGSDHRAPDLSTIQRALQFRSVSVPTDEPLLIGNLLGLNASKILDGPDEERVNRMWSLMPTAARGIPKSILFHLGPRLRQPGFCWAPTSLRGFESSNRILQTALDIDSESTPCNQGLQVKLPGRVLKIGQRPQGLPQDPWNVLGSHINHQVYARSDEGSWYIVRRRLNGPGGDFLSKKGLDTLLRGSHKFWITYLETDFQARSDGAQQTSTALLVKQVQGDDKVQDHDKVHEDDKVLYVRSKAHLHVGLLQKATRDMLEAAYSCAHKLSGSHAAQELSVLGAQESNSYMSAFDALTQEMHRLALEDVNEQPRKIARQTSGKQSEELFEALIAMFFVGQYATLGETLPASQRWCVD